MLLDRVDLQPPTDERDRLIRHICESVRVYMPAEKIALYQQMKARLHKTPLHILRQILEEDVVNVTAAQFVRARVQ